MHHVLLSTAPASETYFTFFSSKVPCKNYFHNIQVSCYCCVTWYESRTNFSLLYSHLRWSFCGVMLLHVARVGAGSFAVLVFLHSSLLAFGRGHTIKQLPRGTGITRTQYARLWTRPSLQIMMKVASQRFSTRAGFRLILSKWFPDLTSAPCKCWRRKRWSLYILNYCKQI